MRSRDGDRADPLQEGDASRGEPDTVADAGAATTEAHDPISRAVSLIPELDLALFRGLAAGYRIGKSLIDTTRVGRAALKAAVCAVDRQDLVNVRNWDRK